MLVGLPNGVIWGPGMQASRMIVATTLLLAIGACSGSDSHSGIDPSNLTASGGGGLSATSVTVAPSSATLHAGDTLTLTATIKNSTGLISGVTGEHATWSSSDTTIAKVSATGLVTTLRAGIATITASAGSGQDNSVITIDSAPTKSTGSTGTTGTGTTGTGTTGTGTTGTGSTSTGSTGSGSTGSGSTTTGSGSTGSSSTGTGSTGSTGSTSSGSGSTSTGSGSGSSTGTSNPPSSGSASSGSGSSASLGSGLSGKAFLYDDFSGYANTQALLAKISTNVGGTASPSTALYNDGGNASLASIDNTVTYNDHPTMKYTQPGGVSTTPELWVDFSAHKHIWFRTKIRFSQGFTTTGTLSNSANAYKLLGFAFDTYDGSGRLEITNTNQYELYWNAQSKTNGSLVGGGVFGQAGNVTTEWSSGGWYDYILDIDFTQSPGVARVWMAPDGQTPVLKATSSGTMQSGLPLPSLTGIMLGMNFNQVRASTQSQAVWWGQWEVVDGTQNPNPFGVN